MLKNGLGQTRGPFHWAFSHLADDMQESASQDLDGHVGIRDAQSRPLCHDLAEIGNQSSAKALVPPGRDIAAP